MTDAHHAILSTLLGLLETIGSANDAQDRGYGEEAQRMREDSCEAIRTLLAEHSFLAALFPTLQWEVESQHLLGFGWANLFDAVKSHLAAPHQTCEICSNLKEEEYAFQKYDWDQGNTCLPAAASRLSLVRDLRPSSSRKLQLQQCPLCGTYYLYRTDYEYLVNGSEDEEFLTRLSPAQAVEFLDRPVLE